MKNRTPHAEITQWPQCKINNKIVLITFKPSVTKLFMAIISRVIHQSPDGSNHRTPSKYRTEIQVIPTSIHLGLLPAESTFTAHQCRARRQAGNFTHVELAVCKSIATACACVWQQIQLSKRLVPASPFTCYIFHGFATRLSG